MDNMSTPRKKPYARGFPLGIPAGFFEKNPIKWMITRGPPISGNLHLSKIVGFSMITKSLKKMPKPARLLVETSIFFGLFGPWPASPVPVIFNSANQSCRLNRNQKPSTSAGFKKGHEKSDKTVMDFWLKDGKTVRLNPKF